MTSSGQAAAMEETEHTEVPMSDVVPMTSRMLWSLLLVAMALLASCALLYLAVGAYKTSGEIFSISEMLVNAPSAERALVQMCVVLAVLGTVVAFTANYPHSAVARFAARSAARSPTGKSCDAFLADAQYASYCIAGGGCQIVIAITYRELKPLHFTAAAIFFFVGVISVSLDMYLECSLTVPAPGPRDCRTARLLVKGAGMLAMIASIVLLVVAVFTYSGIPRIDRRPPLIIGEFVGVGGFLLHALGTMPILQSPRTVHFHMLT